MVDAKSTQAHLETVVRSTPARRISRHGRWKADRSKNGKRHCDLLFKLKHSCHFTCFALRKQLARFHMIPWDVERDSLFWPLSRRHCTVERPHQIYFDRCCENWFTVFLHLYIPLGTAHTNQDSRFSIYIHQISSNLYLVYLKEYIVTRYKLRHDPKPPRLLENKDFHVEQMAASAADAAVCVFFWYSGATVWLVADESCTYVSICFHTQCMYENPSFLSYHLSFLVFFGTTHLT